jgi:hypothetical protein
MQFFYFKPSDELLMLEVTEWSIYYENRCFFIGILLARGDSLNIQTLINIGMY